MRRHRLWKYGSKSISLGFVSNKICCVNQVHAYLSVVTEVNM